MASNFWKLQFKVNYQNEITEGNLGNDSGLTEKYYLTADPSQVNTARADSLNILAARASLLGLNASIVNVALSRSDQARSRYPVLQYPRFGVVMSQDVAVIANQQINEMDDSLLFRFQNNDGRRWTRQIRGVRDRWIVDQTSLPTNTLIGSGVGASLAYPVIQTVPDPSAITEAVFTFTNTGGVLSAPVIASGGTYPLAINGTYPLLIIDQNGVGAGATGTATIAGNTVTAVAITAGGAGYFDALLRLPGRMDVNGLANYQLQLTYLYNFMSVVGQKTMNFHQITIPDASFPSGKQHVIDLTATPPGPYFAGTVGVERVSNRQTGRIWIKRKARRKIGI